MLKFYCVISQDSPLLTHTRPKALSGFRCHKAPQTPPSAEKITRCAFVKTYCNKGVNIGIKLLILA